MASYNGETPNNGAIDNGQNESENIINTSPSISTSASQVANMVRSALLTDSSRYTTLYRSGAGSVTFTLKDPSNNVVYTSTDSDFSDGITSGAYTATAVGTYTWSASYSGDGLNNGAIDNGENETATNNKARPQTSTNARHVRTVARSPVLTVSAGTTGADMQSAGPSLHDALPICNNAVYTSTDSDFSDGITSGAYTATAVGTYTWSASYSGDGLNNGAIDNGQNE